VDGHSTYNSQVTASVFKEYFLSLAEKTFLQDDDHDPPPPPAAATTTTTITTIPPPPPPATATATAAAASNSIQFSTYLRAELNSQWLLAAPLVVIHHTI
jgi:hypothetical protein